MTAAAKMGASFAKRGWPVADVPPMVFGYFVFVQVVAVGCIIQAFLAYHSTGQEWGKVALLIGLAIAFEEFARRAARLRLRLADGPRQELDSVWAFAAVVALPPGLAATVLGAVLIYAWWRQQRPAGKALHRMLFNSANALLACMGASFVLRLSTEAWAGLPAGLDGFLPILLGAVTAVLINRMLVLGALVCMRVKPQGMGVDRDQSLVELASYCLGAFVALALIYQPWLAVLVLAPLVALERGALLRQFETAATTDSKTGLLNAVAWEQVAEREVARAARAATSAAVVIIDIDRFKLVNDKFGHLAGDKVLRAIGQVLASELREYDTVGRFGGEEFVAVLPDADEGDALIAAERLRSRVNQLDVPAVIEEASERYELSVSIGVAVFRDHGTELAELLREADAALYRAKAAGRNRVMLAERGRRRHVSQPVLQT